MREDFDKKIVLFFQFSAHNNVFKDFLGISDIRVFREIPEPVNSCIFYKIDNADNDTDYDNFYNDVHDNNYVTDYEIMII